MDPSKGTGERLPAPSVKEQKLTPAESTEKKDDPVTWEGHGLEKQQPEASSLPKISSGSGAEASVPEETPADHRSVSPVLEFEPFPRGNKELIEALMTMVSLPEKPLVMLDDKRLKQYKARAKSEGLRTDNDFAAAQGKICSVGHLLLECSALDEEARKARKGMIDLIAGGAAKNNFERTNAQLRCWHAQMMLAKAPSLPYADKLQIITALKAANTSVIPMAAWLLAVIHAGLQEGMEEFVSPLAVRQNLAEAAVQFRNHFAGDPLRFSERQLFPMEPDLAKFPERNDKSDSSVCFYLQNMLRGMFGVGCEPQSVIGISVDLQEPMKALSVIFDRIPGLYFNLAAFDKSDRNFFKEIERLSRYTSPRLSALGHLMLFFQNTQGMGCPVSSVVAARHAEKAASTFPRYWLGAACSYQSCLKMEDALRCLDEYNARFPMQTDEVKEQCKILRERVAEARERWLIEEAALKAESQEPGANAQALRKRLQPPGPKHLRYLKKRADHRINQSPSARRRLLSLQYRNLLQAPELY